MANSLHFEKLKEGPTAWNRWRELQPPDLAIDLSGITLPSGNLIGANLSKANLSKAMLISADLSQANLRGASLVMADLRHANLRNANLESANLTNAKLDSTDLHGANLLNTDLTDANVAAAKNYSGEATKNPKIFSEPSSPPIGNPAFENKNNASSSKNVLILNAASLVSQIDEYIEKVRGDNELPMKYPEFMEFLHQLRKSIVELIQAIPELQGAAETSSEVQSWKDRWWNSLNEEFGKYTAPESLAKATIPSGVILTFSSIGGIIGGPLGFGAGGVVGKLFLGTAKADELTKTVEKAYNDNIDIEK